MTVTAANLSDNAVGIQLLDQAKKTYPTISKSRVDAGFKNAVIEHGASLGIDVEVVNRNPEVRGFHVVKRRWVVERSIGWIMLHRRLARDYETLPASSEAMIHVASIDNLTKRITDETTPTWRGTYQEIKGNSPRSNALSGRAVGAPLRHLCGPVHEGRP